MRFHVGPILLALALSVSCSERAALSLPAPTDLGQGQDEREEERLSAGRKRWMEELHRSAPGVDWRAIERANGEREMARRNELVRMGAHESLSAPWSEVGSSNLAGRMMGAALGSDGVTVWAGSALGGLWRGNLSGSAWTPLGDNLHGGVSDVVAIAGEFAGEPDVLMIHNGTVRVTRDLGATWETPTGLSGITSIRRLAKFQTVPPTLVVFAQTTILGNTAALFASTDYGRSFTKRWQAPVIGNSALWIPRVGPNSDTHAYAMVRGQAYVSTNAGASFAPLGLAEASPTDVQLSGSEAGAPTLYATQYASSTWKLWRSNDAGASWSSVHTLNSYYGPLCASSVSPGIVVYGGVEAWRSINAGASFTRINPWTAYYSAPATKLHADIFGLWVAPDPVDPVEETWLFGTDGGSYKSLDWAATVQNLSLSGLGVSQYYSTLTSNVNPTFIHAGSQDQGYQRGIYVAPSGGGPSTPFTQLISGDYGHLTSSDGSHGLVYCTYPGFIQIYEGETNPVGRSANFPSGAANLWLPPVVADPLDADSFFFLGNQLWRYTRQTSSSWSHVVHSAQSFVAPGSYLTALGFAPSDAQRCYATNDAGRIWYSTNHGVTWTQSVNTAPGEHYFYGNDVAVHPTNPLEAVISGAGYSTSAVIRTTDGGVTWQPLDNGLPQTLVYSIAYAPSGDLYAGMETGALEWDRASATWSQISSLGSPITLYWSVEILPGGQVARFGTYGRGIWDHAITPAPAWVTYGTGKVNSQGNLPSIDATGTPAFSIDDFEIQVYDALPNKPGILMYSSGQAQIPFQGGTLWLALPVQRGPTFTLDPFGFASVPIPIDATMVGLERYFQAWYRDPPHPDLTGVGLSNGGHATFGN